jgi:hypothetical protein
MKVENEDPWWPIKGVPKDQKWPKMAKIDQNFEYLLFCSHPIHSGNKFSSFYSDLMRGE